MWYALLWRVLSWFTWTHCQWIMVQALGPKGLDMTFDRIMTAMSHEKKLAGKPFSKISAQDIREHLDTTGTWK